MAELSEPMLVIGAGGVGARVALQVREKTGCECLQISNNPADFDSGCKSIEISNQGVINPSGHLVRGSAGRSSDEILDAVSGYSSIVIIASLAGKSGAAISPIVSRICRDAGKSTVSFAIMPFGFENTKMFSSAISLKRLRASSDCTVIVDNDAILQCNPDLTQAKCHEITNSAISYIAGSLKTSGIPDGASLISTSKDGLELETSLRDSLKMLYSASGDAGRTVLHVLGADRIPVGILETVAGLTGGMSGTNADYTSDSSEHSKIVMVSALQTKTRFDAYDPLDAIPLRDTLDWDEPECSIGCSIDLPQLE